MVTKNPNTPWSKADLLQFPIPDLPVRIGERVFQGRVLSRGPFCRISIIVPVEGAKATVNVTWEYHVDTVLRVLNGELPHL